MASIQKASVVLKIGLAFSFAYAAVGSMTNPDAWLGFFPTPVLQLIPASILTYGFALTEILIALSLLVCKDVLVVAWISAVLLLGIVVFNVGALDIVFRDVSLALAAVALAFLHTKPRGAQTFD